MADLSPEKSVRRLDPPGSLAHWEKRLQENGVTIQDEELWFGERTLPSEDPHGYTDRNIQPEAAYYLDDMGEFVLPHEAVRNADDSDALLLMFLQSTYEAAADLAEWDRDALEGDAPPA
ncbi:DUF5996 family protein [Salinibacter altiplanensis]|uniref:DUF5996 family protein n=1 Tax=Salinibacter altiplanensis TaxID=1803181 RepID=UPI000C9F84CF|nr:DUF5996 family protein [Salinibacter altiplanensis]